MRRYLREEYPSSDLVAGAVVHITGSWTILVGDIPIRRVEASISGCKGYIAYFDERTGDHVSYMWPDYRMASHQKVDWPVVQAMRNGTPDIPIVVYLMAPDSAAPVRQYVAGFVQGISGLDGVSDIRPQDSILSLRLNASPAAIEALAAMPEVEAIGSNAPLQLVPFG